jgi:uncharacterized protein
MRLLVEFSHPAQVHKFKNVLNRLRARGAAVRVLSRDKDVMLDLLDALGIDHICISRARSGYIGAFCELLVREWRTFLEVVRFRPTLLLSAHSVAITHIAWLMRIPCIVHEDTEFATLIQRLYIPFASQIVTTTAYYKDWGSRQIRISSLEPLAYLHPSQFNPDTSVLSKYGLSQDGPYVVLRLIAWRALHDHGVCGFTDEDVSRLVEVVTAAGIKQLVVSAESNRRGGIVADAIIPNPPDLHHLLAFASLCISESITVAGEAAVLGVPTILVNPLEAGHTRDLERYGLVERIIDIEAVVARVGAILGDSSIREAKSHARKRLLAEKVSFTDAFESLLLDAQRESSALLH